MSNLFPQNLHVMDRGARIVLGVCLLGLLAVGPVPGWGLFGLLGLVLLFTAVAGSCPIYTVFGVSTCALEKHKV